MRMDWQHMSTVQMDANKQNTNTHQISVKRYTTDLPLSRLRWEWSGSTCRQWKWTQTNKTQTHIKYPWNVIQQTYLFLVFDDNGLAAHFGSANGATLSISVRAALVRNRLRALGAHQLLIIIRSTCMMTYCEIFAVLFSGPFYIVTKRCTSYREQHNRIT
jgi:hypothetical protein